MIFKKIFSILFISSMCVTASFADNEINPENKPAEEEMGEPMDSTTRSLSSRLCSQSLATTFSRQQCAISAHRTAWEALVRARSTALVSQVTCIAR